FMPSAGPVPAYGPAPGPDGSGGRPLRRRGYGRGGCSVAAHTERTPRRAAPDPPPKPDGTESARDPQRVRDRHRPPRRPPGRRTGSDGTPDPAGRPGRRLPSPRARRAGPPVRVAAGPLPADPGPGDRLRHGLPRGVDAPGRTRHRRAGVDARRPVPPGGP